MKPTMDEMLPDRKAPNPKGDSLWANDAANELWESARGELLGYANHLERSGAKITADQIRMAVSGSDYHYIKQRLIN